MKSQYSPDDLIWIVLQDIKKAYEEEGSFELVEFSYQDISDRLEEVSVTQISDIISQLEYKGIIKNQSPLGSGGTYRLTIYYDLFKAEYSRYEITYNVPSTPVYSQDQLKLQFFEKSGIAIYKDVRSEFKGKINALLTFLGKSKNTTFSISEIARNCNPDIPNNRYYFRGKKDSRDTFYYLRKRMKVNKGEYFPVQFAENNWKWAENSSP